MRIDLELPADVQACELGEICSFTQGVQIPTSETFPEPASGLVVSQFEYDGYKRCNLTRASREENCQLTVAC